MQLCNVIALHMVSVKIQVQNLSVNIYVYNHPPPQAMPGPFEQSENNAEGSLDLTAMSASNDDQDIQGPVRKRGLYNNLPTPRPTMSPTWRFRDTPGLPSQQKQQLQNTTLGHNYSQEIKTRPVPGPGRL